MSITPAPPTPAVAPYREDLTLALFQCTPLPLDCEGNLARMDAQAALAAAAGADVLICPEMFLTGYCIGPAAAAALAQPADGVFADAVAAMARRHHIAIAYGYPERNPHGRPFNAAQWISASGERCLNHRKTHLYGTLDRTQFAAGEAATDTLVLKGWRIGMLICYDVEFPENTRRLALAGADLVVVPTANMESFGSISNILVPARAFENQIAVAYANYVGAEDTLHYAGLSTVAHADGVNISQAGTEPQLLMATLRTEGLDEARRRNTHLLEAAERLRANLQGDNDEF